MHHLMCRWSFNPALLKEEPEEEPEDQGKECAGSFKRYALLYLSYVLPVTLV